MVPLVLYLAPARTLLPSHLSLHCYVGNLMVHLLLYLASVFTLLSCLLPFLSYVAMFLIFWLLPSFYKLFSSLYFILKMGKFSCRY
jgi:hypothetical protein